MGGGERTIVSQSMQLLKYFKRVNACKSIKEERKEEGEERTFASRSTRAWRRSVSHLARLKASSYWSTRSATRARRRISCSHGSTISRSNRFSYPRRSKHNETQIKSGSR